MRELAQATAFLAAVPKSNRAGKAYFAARAAVEERGSLPVPPHLRNAPVARMKTHGIGVGYRYPHDLPGADVDHQHLPDALAGTAFYEPSDQGFGRQLGELWSGGGSGGGGTRGPGMARPSQERARIASRLNEASPLVPVPGWLPGAAVPHLPSRPAGAASNVAPPGS